MAEEKTEQQSEQAQGKPQKPTLFIILAIVNMIVVIGVGAMLYLGKQKEAAKPSIDQVVQGENEALKKDNEKEEEIIGEVVPLETFIVNLAGSRGRKVVKVNMEFEVKGEKILEEIDKRKAQIRDIIIILLSSKTYNDIASRDGKSFLREEIKDTVNAFLTQGKVKKVYFTDLVYN